MYYTSAVNRLPWEYLWHNKRCNAQIAYLQYISAMNRWTPQVYVYHKQIGYLRYISALNRWTASVQIYLCRYCYNRQINRLPQVFYYCYKPYRLPQVYYLCNMQMDYLRYLCNIQQTISNILSLQHTNRLSHVCYLCNTQMDYLRYATYATHKRTTSGMLSL